MGSPRPRKSKKSTEKPPVARQELVLIQLTIPGYKPIQGIVSVEGRGAFNLNDVMKDAHVLLRDLYLNLQSNE